jgi:hypothetical protein
LAARRELSAMRFDVEKAAKLTIEEGDRSGPRFARWQPRSEEANENSVSTSGGYARTAGDEAPATYPQRKNRLSAQLSLVPTFPRTTRPHA